MQDSERRCGFTARPKSLTGQGVRPRSVTPQGSWETGSNPSNRPLEAVAKSRLDLVSTKTRHFRGESMTRSWPGVGRRCSKSEATSPLPMEDGAYTAPISPETRQHATARAGTQRDEHPMGTRLFPITSDGAGSLGMGFR
jgi:hypothetical protein